MTELDELLARVRAVGGAYAPATAAAVRAAEHDLGRPLPDGLRALYRRADGVDGVAFAGAYRLGTLEQLLARWHLGMRRQRVSATDDYFSWAWLPVLHAERACLAWDSAVAPDGACGQLVLVDPRQGFRDVVAPSLWAWLAAAVVESADGRRSDPRHALAHALPRPPIPASLDDVPTETFDVPTETFAVRPPGLTRRAP